MISYSKILQFRGRLAAVAIGLVTFGVTMAIRGNSAPKLATHQVQRGDFIAAVSETGTLEPVEQTVLRCELDGRGRIVFIAPEGTYAKKGDLLVEMDAGTVEENLTRRELSHEKRVASLASAENRLLVVESDAESDVRKAELAVEFAEMDLAKFANLQKEQQIRDGEIDIDTASESLRLATDRHQWSAKLVKRGFETKSTLDRDRLSMISESARLEKAQSQQQMLTRFDLLKKEVKLRSEVSELRSKLTRVLKESQSRTVQAKAKLRSAKETVAISSGDLQQAKKQLVATKVYAPHDGLVVYATSSSRYSRESVIEEGASVRNRQALIKMPNTSSMKMEIKVHESMASMVAVGQQAFVRLESVPDKQFRAEVTKVAVFPDKQSWWGNPDLKVYATELRVLDDLGIVNPGATADAHIIVDRRPEVVMVPSKAVSTYQGHKVCHIRHGRGYRTVPVEVGGYNGEDVHITSGLNVGDFIVAEAIANQVYRLDDRLKFSPKTTKQTRLVAKPSGPDDLS